MSVTTTSKNLGLVAAAVRRATAPDNTDLIWLDTSGSVMVRKVWNPLANVWETLGGDSTTTGDGWGTQIIVHGEELEGEGTVDIPLILAQQGATTGQVLKWDGTSWSPADDEVGAGLEIVSVDTDIFQGDGTVGNPLKLKATIDGYIPKYNATTQKWYFAPDNDTNPIAKGMVIMWAGSIGSIPSGWALCNGNANVPINGVAIPNLSGRFIVGYDAADADYNAIGHNGGLKQVTLTIAQIPEHGHSATQSDHFHYAFANIDGGGGNVSSTTYANRSAGLGGNSSYNIQGNSSQASVGKTSPASTTITVANTGGGQSHENRPPYFTLAYLIRVA